MTPGGGPVEAGGQEDQHTSVTMPISDRHPWWECSKGDLFRHHTSVCLLVWPLRSHWDGETGSRGHQREPGTSGPGVARRKKKQCCVKMCSEETACSPSFIPASPPPPIIPPPLQSPSSTGANAAKGSLKLTRLKASAHLAFPQLH